MSEGIPADPEQELQRELSSILSEPAGTHEGIASVRRRPSPYRSSSHLEEVDVLWNDGLALELIFKDVGPGPVGPDGRAKPAFLHEPLREIETYRRILRPHGLTAPLCYGAAVDPSKNRHWLFLERVKGVELYQIGDLDVWAEAARWVARMHARFAGDSEAAGADVPLLRHDRDFYAIWPERAVQVLAESGREADALRVRPLADRYEPVVARLTSLPTTLVHGEFYASNVLVEEREDGVRIAPIDWEMAAIGPGLVDVAALAAGWGPDQRRELVDAYRDELGGDTETGMEEALVCSRLHLAMQWLGWSSAWSPPPEHRRDWLGEALAAARELEL